MSALLCVLLPAAMWLAIPGLAWSGGGETSGQNPQWRIRAFKIEKPLPLDGDLGKWCGADSVAFEGGPLAGHPRCASCLPQWEGQGGG